MMMSATLTLCPRPRRSPNEHAQAICPVGGQGCVFFDPSALFLARGTALLACREISFSTYLQMAGAHPRDGVTHYSDGEGALAHSTVKDRQRGSTDKDL